MTCDILFLSAHPDDVEFGMGCTHLKLARNHKTAHVILTRGEAGTFGTPESREQEIADASKISGSSYEFLDFKDCMLEDTVENGVKLAAVIRKYKPKIVFTPYHTNHSTHTDYLSHPDHTALGKLTLRACRLAKFKNAPVAGEQHAVEKIIYYMVPRYMKPNLIVDVSDVMEDAKKLWNCFSSQLQIANNGVLVFLETIRKYAGLLNKTEYAESFIIEQPVELTVENIFDI